VPAAERLIDGRDGPAHTAKPRISSQKRLPPSGPQHRAWGKIKELLQTRFVNDLPRDRHIEQQIGDATGIEWGPTPSSIQILTGRNVTRTTSAFHRASMDANDRSAKQNDLRPSWLIVIADHGTGVLRTA